METKVQQLLADHAPEVRDLTLRTRDLVRELLPYAHENVDAGARTIRYSYSAGGEGTICVIGPHADHVRIQIAGAAGLPDPDGLLQGADEPYLVVRSPEDLRRKGIRTLVLGAAKAARHPPGSDSSSDTGA